MEPSIHQERIDESRSSLSEARRNMATINERMHSLQSELHQSQLQREQVEAEVTKSQEVERPLVTSMFHSQRASVPDVAYHSCVVVHCAAGFAAAFDHPR